jgi:hypothetical protein
VVVAQQGPPSQQPAAASGPGIAAPQPAAAARQQQGVRRQPPATCLRPAASAQHRVSGTHVKPTLAFSRGSFVPQPNLPARIFLFLLRLLTADDPATETE